jgi:hypothetical protein
MERKTAERFMKTSMLKNGGQLEMEYCQEEHAGGYSIQQVHNLTEFILRERFHA